MLRAAGYTSAAAMSEYGMVYGMVMPVMAVPCAFIGSIALVLVPELSEQFYRGNKEQVRALVSRAINATLLISCALLPFYLVCGEGVGIMLYSNAKSGELISRCAFILLPMGITMITTSILNSLGCEKKTLAIFLCGSAGMLLSVLILPRFLGSGALVVGMTCDSCITAILSLFLLGKKTGGMRITGHFLRLLAACLPATVLGFVAHHALERVVNYLPALALSMLVILIAEFVLFSLLGLISPRAMFTRFLQKKRKKTPMNS